MKGALTLLGRADLLRALARAGADASQGLRHAETLGFQLEVPDTIKEEGGETAQAHLVLPALEASGGSAPALPPLQTSFFLLTGYRPLPDAPPADQLPAGQATPETPPPLAEKDCQPRDLPLPFQPLVRRQRLWPQLRQSLQHDWMDGLDLPRLVARLARGDLPRSLPARRHSGLTARIFILWDAAERLSPYFEDYRRLIAELHRLTGTAGLRLWRVHDGPDEVWGEWCPERVALPQRWAGETWHKPGTAATRGLPPIPAGSRVLILSDMGGLARHTAPSRRWLRALGRWRAAGVSTTAWVPQGPRWVAPALVAAVDDVHCLTARPLRLRASGRPGADSLEAHLQRRLPPWAALCKALLVRASICIHLEPALLRSLRHTDPALAAEPGLEALAWSGQPVVRSSRISRALAPEYGPVYRQGFAELPAQVQRDVLQRVTAAHAALGRSTEVTEVLIWQAHARQDALEREKEALERAERWTLAWSALVEQGAASPLAASAGAYARDLLARLGNDSKWMKTQADWASHLVLTAEATQIPAGLPAEALARAADRLRPQPGLLDLSFSTRGDRLLLDAVPGAATQAPDLGARITTPRGLVSRSDGSRAWLDRSVSAFQLAHRGTIGQQVWVRTDALEYEFTELARPAWACDWGRDRYGHFARIDVAGVRQTLRWIPPGCFLMGSPEDERDRFDDEGPQHQVTLTRGFWLSDTACTQALWLAVLGGENPSRFSGDPERPVEKVSWNEVTGRFLPGLQRRLGAEVEAVLPTEAEWEYACRAGTKTAYSFGEAFEPSRANVNSKETVPVKAYPPNPWGLYQMHGNVREWCADDGRPYGAGPVTDPAGDRAGAGRALRGGAWRSVPGGARSAFRGGSRRGDRFDSTGFRFALRSIQGGAGGGMGRAEPALDVPRAEPGRISGGVGTRHSPKS